MLAIINMHMIARRNRQAARRQQQPQPPNTVPTTANIIFLHHSTGGVIWDGGVADWFTAYNTAHTTEYKIRERAYPNNPYPWANYPYDYWNIWINPNADEIAKSQASLDALTAEYNVIIFKHCFPVSNIAADTGNASVSSETKSIENYQLQYAALKTKLHSYPNTKFILWTGAALTQTTSSSALARSRQFFDWVKTTWDEPGDNIYLWDFYELETEGGNFLLDKYATSASDAHPNSTFAKTVAPYFAQRIVNVIRGENLSDIIGRN